MIARAKRRMGPRFQLGGMIRQPPEQMTDDKLRIRSTAQGPRESVIVNCHGSEPGTHGSYGTGLRKAFPFVLLMTDKAARRDPADYVDSPEKTSSGSSTGR
jgi:hypothetical protein